MRGRRITGIVLVTLGLALLVGALSLFLYNRNLAAEARQAADDVLEELVPIIRDSAPEEQSADTEMETVEIDGEAYIGVLSVPALSLELPVMAAWSYPGLRTAPGRYTGTLLGRDLVIAAHNYLHHFGRLNRLAIGDEVRFTDVRGLQMTYRVADLEILPPTAVEEMTAGEYDLTLFTCTYGGRTRFTVRCLLAD